MIRKSPLLLMLLLCLQVSAAAAEEVQVTSTLDKVSAQVGEELHLTIRIAGANTNIQAPRLPAFKGFDTFYTGRASHLTFINGRSTSNVEFSYVLVAREAGHHPLSGIEVQVGDRRFTTNPVEVEVTGGAAQPNPFQRPSLQQPPASSPAPFPPSSAPSSTPSPVGTPMQEPPPAVMPNDDSIFVRAWTDKTTAYPNEQILLTYSLYTRHDTRYEGFDKEPEVSGFWIEDFPMDRDIPRETVRVNGKRYIKADIKKMALFPTAAADYTIDPGTIKASIRQDPQANSVFDEFFNDSFFSGGGFFAQREDRRLQPAPIQITVLPFPEQGKPADFQGATGNFRMTATLDKEAVKQNEPVIMKLAIEGEGNIETLNKPKIPELKGFKIYDSDTSSQLFKTGNVIGGRKLFEIVFIPVEAGVKKIPSFAFSFFNPVTRAYTSLRTPEFTLNITPSEQTFKLPVALSGDQTLKKDVERESQDIRYIRERIPEGKGNGFFRLASRGFLGADIFLTFLFFVGFIRSRQEKVYARDQALRRRRQARTLAEARIRKLKSGKDTPAFFEGVEKILTQYFADKLNFSASGIGRYELESRVEAFFGAQDPLVAEIRELYLICDESRFARADVAEHHKAKALKILREAISRVEKGSARGLFARKLPVVLVFFLSVFAAPLFAAPVETLQEKAHQAYRSGDYEAAARQYRELAAEYPDQAGYSFNLGNALHRKGELGAAILAYERSLLLEPRDPDTRYNLNYLKGLAEYRIADTRNWYLKMLEAFLSYLTAEEVWFTTFFCYFIFAAVVVFSIFFRGGIPWGWGRKSLLVLAVAALALAGGKHAQETFLRAAIVLKDKAPVRYGPSVTDQTAFRLGEGMKIHVVDARKGWSRVLLPNGESGWMQHDDIAEVRKQG